jgi:hypothetical protein
MRRTRPAADNAAGKRLSRIATLTGPHRRVPLPGESDSECDAWRMSDRSELEFAWQRLRGTPIPSLSSEDVELDDLRVDLIEFDGHAAGLVSTVLGPARPDMPLDDDADLRRRVERRTADADPEAAADARKLEAYLAQLEQIVALARRVLP